MDLFFFDKLGFQQPGRLSLAPRGLAVLALPLSGVGGLPRRGCIETRAAFFHPTPFFKPIINRCLEVLF